MCLFAYMDCKGAFFYDCPVQACRSVDHSWSSYSKHEADRARLYLYKKFDFKLPSNLGTDLEV